MFKEILREFQHYLRGKDMAKDFMKRNILQIVIIIILSSCIIMINVNIGIMILLIYLTYKFTKMYYESKIIKIHNDVIMKNVGIENHNTTKGINNLEEDLYQLTDLVEKLEIKQRQYIESNEKLKKLDDVKTDFLSTISHEFRIPLTSIIGFAKIIKRKINKNVLPILNNSDGEIHTEALEICKTNMKKTLESLEIIISEGERLSTMIDNILDIAKIEAEAVEWKKEKIDIEEIINKAILSSFFLLEGKEIEIVDKIEKDLPVVIGDKDRITQVVINLISNAIKFTEKGKIICEAHRENTEVIVTIEDTGIGIKEEYLDLVFERFKQCKDTMIDKPKGTGLGLAISKAIIMQHNGKIWAESEEGKGSKFKFSIPI